MERLIIRNASFADFSRTPLTCISPLYECISSEGIKVSLDGHGGDECLMGYPDMISAAIEISPLEDKRNLQLTLNEMLRTRSTLTNIIFRFLQKQGSL